MSDANIDDDLDFTQGLRRRLANALAPDVDNLSTDPDQVNILLKTLKDIDAQALTLKKISSDEKTASEDRVVHEATMRVLEKIAENNGSDNATYTDPFRGGNSVRRTIEIDASALGDYVISDGEKRIEPVKTNFAQFMSKNDPSFTQQ